MAFPLEISIGIMKDNLSKRHSVLPIPRRDAMRWTKGLNLPEGGETVLYTGCMYQLVPYISATVKYAEKYGDSALKSLAGLGRSLNKIVNLTGFLGFFSKKEDDEYQEILRSIAKLLLRVGIEFGYLYEDEYYSGALLYDLGVDDTFTSHARFVYEIFKKRGVKRLITVDPHTTNMLRSVYPEIIPDFDLEVKSYLEILAENVENLKPIKKVDATVVIHDPCVYARYEGIIEEPRILLERAGYKVIEPRNSGKLTFCCGGPIESLYPEKALDIGKRRVDELGEFGVNVVTMCPICLANLRRANKNLKIMDIALYLKEAFLE